MERLYRSLCSKPINEQACGRCEWRVLDPDFLSRVSLRSTVGLAISLLVQVRYDNEIMCPELSYSTCKGKVHLQTTPGYNAYNTNLDVCDEIFNSWECSGIVEREDAFELGQIREILDTTGRLRSLIIALQLIFAQTDLHIINVAAYAANTYSNNV